MPQDTKDPKNVEPYAGRWIAWLKGRVVGQGGTPKQAEQAAKSNRPKETPQVSYVPTSSSLNFSPYVAKVQAVLPEKSDVYLVGGAVRDALLQRESHDLDFTVQKDTLKIARKVANLLEGAYYRMDDEHQTGRVILTTKEGKRIVMDFAAMRGENLIADLEKRDFTINAMAIDLKKTQELLDPLGGLVDLHNKTLRMCAPDSFSSDPVRVLRAIRVAATFKLKMTKETRQALKATVSGLSNISPERVRDELFKLLAAPKPATSMRALEMLGVLKFCLPELTELKSVEQPTPHLYDVWEHTLKVVDQLGTILQVLDAGYEHDNESGGDLISGLLSLRLGRYREQITKHLDQKTNPERDRRTLFLLASLYHDSAKPFTPTVEEEGRLRMPGHAKDSSKIAGRRGKTLRLSNTEVERIKIIVKYHGEVRKISRHTKEPSPLEIYHFFKATGDAGVEVVLHSLADIIGAYGPNLPQDTLSQHLDVMRSLLEAYWEHPERVNPPILVDGNDLLVNLKLKPGPKIGELIERIREAQITGEVNTREEAINFAKQHIG